MASCYICGKRKMVGHNVSHAHNKTKRWFHRNLQMMRIVTDKGIKRVSVCTSCLRSGRVKKAV